MNGIAQLYFSGQVPPLPTVSESDLTERAPTDWANQLSTVCPTLHSFAQEARAVLLGTSGAAVLRELPCPADFDEHQTLIHAFYCAMLPDHTLVSANGSSPYWKVTDRGGTTFSLNNTYSPAHQDAVTHDPRVPIIGLAGIQAAARGGETFLVDANEAVERLESSKQGKEALEILANVPIPHLRHSAFGAAHRVLQPVLRNGHVLWRPDLIDWQSDVVSAEIRSALDLFARSLEELRRFEVRIEPGEILIWNQSRGLLHGRYAYYGSRLLLRAWFAPVE